MSEETGSNGITRRGSDEIAQYVMELEVVPREQEAGELVNNLSRIPFAELATLGAGLSKLPEAARTITQTVSTGSGEALYRCVFPEGVSGTLAQAKDGSGYLGAIMDDGVAGQARWIPVQPGATTVSTVVPFDPVTLAVTVALASVNAKLDKIQETQQQILDFLKRDKESEQVGDLKSLVDILKRYKYNWNNETFVASNLTTVQQIQGRARKNIEFYWGSAWKAAKAKMPVHGTLRVGQKRDNVIRELKQYQAAAYLYSFAAMLDALLLKNFSPEYLSEVERGIERESVRYRQLYTELYDKVGELQRGSVESVVVKGFSDVTRGLGKAIAQTPVLGAGPVDEFLIGVGNGAGKFGDKMYDDVMGELVASQAAQVRPFMATIENVDRLCNQPNELLIGKDSIYLTLAE